MRSVAMLKNGLSQSFSIQPTWTVESVKQVRYHVIAVNDLFDPSETALLRACPEAPLAAGDRRLVVIDSNVATLHGDRIAAWFTANGVDATILVVHADETVKDWESVTRVVDKMNEFGIDRRREPVIAIGGGVLLDVVGFATSLYRRGTPYIRIPTTLVGLVDAGVGVKTGVNYERGKNRIGTYAPAIATFADRTFLRTLDDRHLANGLAEILKLALVKSAELFTLLQKFGPELIADHFQGTTPQTDQAARQVVTEAIHLMLEELQPNLWETTLERCVDYGHTFSPVLEITALPGLLHGEAVCIDMALTSVLGFRRGDVSGAELDQILSVMTQLRLPIWDEVLTRPGILDAALADTVRHRDGQQRLPLPLGIGRHRFVNDVTPAELAAGLDHLAAAAAQRIGDKFADAG
ncbi:sedoheptulose 7-phosphate cyclase [Nocardia sp. CNY236]|uniref:sedoheptulose 7-phosphate cyclase n=1 Tax=Nocardia sp. CNY236 TaxID=1169152 RepID=UPI00040BDED7|nr:sedoheptulose 7-phosphate cyclase [Nocardia sp. CNY236]